jgi:hypothetical protein
MHCTALHYYQLPCRFFLILIVVSMLAEVGGIIALSALGKVLAVVGSVLCWWW